MFVNILMYQMLFFFFAQFTKSDKKYTPNSSAICKSKML